MTPKERVHFFLKTKKGRVATVSLLLVLAAMVGLDQISKIHAHNTLMFFQDPDDILRFGQTPFPVGSLGHREDGSFISLTFHYSRNPGAAFSLFADLPDWFRVPFFHTFTLIAVVMIFFYLAHTPLQHRWSRLGLVLILAGAIGNFIDRVRLGYVIDFLDFDWRVFGWRHDFAIFNVADVSINIGMALFVLELLFKKEKQGEAIETDSQKQLND